MTSETMRFAVMTHPRAGNVFLETLIASKLKPALVVTQDPFFVSHHSSLRPLRWAKRQVRYALNRSAIQQRHQTHFTARRHRIATLPAQIVNTQKAACVLQSLDLDYIFVFGFAMLR